MNYFNRLKKKPKKKKITEILGLSIIILACIGVLYLSFWVLEIYNDANRIANFDYSTC